MKLSIKKPIAVAAFFGYLILYWHRLLLDAQIPFDGNTLRFFYPFWAIGNNMLKDGHYFLWNTAFNMGQPFLADPQTHAVYPLRIICAGLSFLNYFRIYIIFHTTVLFSFSYLLARRWHNTFPSLIAALLMAFGGVALARATNHHFAALAWAPAVLYFGLSQRPFLLAIALTLQWLCGFPPFFILTIALLMAFHFADRTDHFPLFMGLLMGAGLSLFQSLPFLEMVRESTRGVFVSNAVAVENSVHPLDLLARLFLTGPSINNLRASGSGDPCIVDFYIGLPALILAIWGYIKGRKWQKLWAGGCVGALFLSLGQYNPLYTHIPLINVFRFPGNWLLIFTVCTSLLAASGAQQLKNKKRQWVFAGMIALDLLIYAWPLHTPWGRENFFTEWPALVQGLARPETGERMYHTNMIMENVPSWKMSAPEEWLLMKGLLLPSYGAAFGIREVYSYHQLYSRRHVNFLQRLGHSPLNSPLFAYAGIRYVVSVTEGGSKKSPPEWNDCGAFVLPRPPGRAFTLPANTVTVQEDKPGHFEATAKGPATLVFSESFYPGWKVSVDGRESQLLPFEETFLATTLTDGIHDVKFTYHPLSLKIGIMGTVLTALSMISWLLL